MMESDLATGSSHPHVSLARRHLDELPTAAEEQGAEVVRGVHSGHIEPKLDDAGRRHISER